MPDLISKLKNDEDIYAIHVSAARTQVKDVEDDFFAQLFSQMVFHHRGQFKSWFSKSAFPLFARYVADTNRICLSIC